MIKEEMEHISELQDTIGLVRARPDIEEKAELIGKITAFQMEIATGRKRSSPCINKMMASKSGPAWPTP